jgi:hypothetical protein
VRQEIPQTVTIPHPATTQPAKVAMEMQSLVTSHPSIARALASASSSLMSGETTCGWAAPNSTSELYTANACTRRSKKCLHKLTEALHQAKDRKKKCGGFDPNFCKDTNPCCAEYCDLPNIAYVDHDTDYGTVASYVRMHMIWGEVWESSHKGLREIGVSMSRQVIMCRS